MMADSDWLLPLAGVLVGTVLGAVAHRQRFCTLGAFERYWYAGDGDGLRTWTLAAVVALLATSLLGLTGQFDPATSFYLPARLNVIGALGGGLLFGIGMALVGTCAFGALVRIGSGSLGSIVVAAFIGLTALTMQRGRLAELRERWIEPTAIDVSAAGSQSLPDLAAYVTGLAAAGPMTVVAIVVALLWMVFREPGYRRLHRSHGAAVLIGLAITAGWFACTVLSQRLFGPVQIESASFVLPPGESLLLLIAPRFQVPDYGVGLVLGTVLGAFASAALARELRWEACDDARELGRHLLGAFLMGAGGVLAGGCTIGQGLSAFSVLAVSAPLALLGIALGARLGLMWLIEGRLWSPRIRKAST